MVLDVVMCSVLGSVPCWVVLCYVQCMLCVFAVYFPVLCVFAVYFPVLCVV